MQRRRVLRLQPDAPARDLTDQLAGEEPLEISLDGAPWLVTLRTPGADFELVLGLLHAEGLIESAGDVVSMSYRGGVEADGTRSYNHLAVTLRGPARTPRQQRPTYVSASCGACGTATIDALARPSRFVIGLDRSRVELARVLGWPDRLRAAQQLFERTGGVHAAALVDLTRDELLCVREDIGRHNAVDKVIGWALQQDRLPLTATALQVSGRLAFELVQKAELAGICLVSAVSAPSSLAVDQADRAGITLLGFSRGRSVNVYSHPERVV